MKNFFKKHIWFVLLFMTISVSGLYAAWVRIVDFTQTAWPWDKVTPEWMNLVRQQIRPTAINDGDDSNKLATTARVKANTAGATTWWGGGCYYTDSAVCFNWYSLASWSFRNDWVSHKICCSWGWTEPSCWQFADKYITTLPTWTNACSNGTPSTPVYEASTWKITWICWYWSVWSVNCASLWWHIQPSLGTFFAVIPGWCTDTTNPTCTWWTDTLRKNHPFAVDYCNKLTYGWESDWVLPTQPELLLMYNNKAMIWGTSGTPHYWSSNKDDNGDALPVSFSTGHLSSFEPIYNTYYTRCIRK